MLDDRPLIGAQFRQLADEYDQGHIHPLKSLDVDERAGTLVIAAFRRGYLSDLPGLGELVDWVENPPPEPAGMKCYMIPCAANLWMELLGNNKISVENLGSGNLKIVDDRFCGGIMPGEFPDLLRGPKIDAASDSILRKQRAAVCRWLAAKIENSPQDLAEARNCWVYYEALRGTTWKAIRDGVAGNTKWEPFETDNGVKDAARRYAEKHRLSPIPERRSGRRRNTK